MPPSPATLTRGGFHQPHIHYVTFYGFFHSISMFITNCWVYSSKYLHFYLFTQFIEGFRRMRKAAIAVLSSLVASVLFTVASSSSPAFGSVIPVDCNATGMLQIINIVDTSVTVNEMDVVADPVNASLTPLYTINFTGNQVKFNGAGINPIDNQIYGSLKHSDGAYFVRLGSDGFEYLFMLDAAHTFIADFDINGDYIYYTSDYHKIPDSHSLTGYATRAEVDAADPDDTSVFNIYDSPTGPGADIAVVRSDNNDVIAIGVSNANNIILHNITTGNEIIVGKNEANVPNGTQWGAMYSFDNNGNDLVYASDNYEEGIIQIPWQNYLNGNTNVDVTEVVANSAPTAFNDGANCKSAPPPAMPCGFPGLSGITADDPLCVETTTINTVDPVACASTSGIQTVNSDNDQATTLAGTSGSSPYTEMHMFNVDPASGQVVSFSPEWTVDIASYDIVAINATGINPIDDTLYGYAQMTDGTWVIVRFDAEGDLEFVHTGIDRWIYTGAFTKDGTYIIHNDNTGKAHSLANLHTLDGWATKADLDNSNPTNSWVEGTSNSTRIISDWAVVTDSNGHDIAIGIGNGGFPYQILKYNFNTDTWSQTQATLANIGSNGWGALYSYADNSVYASNNGGFGLYQILWDQPLINNEIQMVEVFASTTATSSNDGATCMDQNPDFPCAYDASLTFDDPNCEPDVGYTVVNNLQCQSGTDDRTYTITNTAQVGGEFMITNEANNQQYAGVELAPGESFTWNFDTTFSIVEDAVNDFRVDIDWIDTNNDASYIIDIPTFIDNFVDCDPKAPVEWTNNPCSNDKEASFELDLTETIHDVNTIRFTFNGGSLVGSDPITYPTPPVNGYGAGNEFTFTFDIDEQDSSEIITVQVYLLFSNGVERTHQFTHGAQDCLQSSFNNTFNWNCQGSSFDYNNDGDYPAVITLTNNGVTTTTTYQPGDSGSIPLNWLEDTTNSLSIQGSFSGDPENPPAAIMANYFNKKVACQPPTVQIEEGGDSYTFTITPPCAVNDYGVIPVDTDPDTPGTQITDEFTYSISLLENGDLAITVDDVDDLEIDGTTFDDIIVYYSGPDCEPEDCMNGNAGTCQVQIEVEVPDNDDFDGQVNVTIDVTCISASLNVTNDGVADLTLSITNNGTVSTLTLSPDASETVDLGWAEDSTNTVTYVGMFNGVDGQAEGNFTDVKVDCEPPEVELAEGLESFTFTITPPCSVNDYGVIPVDTDPDTPGTQITDEFTYSISLLANGDLEITVDDVDDLEIDGTTFDDIIVYYSGPDCEPEDCMNGNAGTCQVQIEVLVFDNDDPEELRATGAAHVRMIGLSILIAMLGYGFLHLAQLYGPALLVRVVQYRKIHNTVRVEGSRKGFKVWKKVRKD